MLPLGMRTTGFVDSVVGLGIHDHICWAFDSPDEFRSVAARFLAEGLAGGQRVVFIGDAVGDDDLDMIDGFAAARAADAARVQDVGIYAAIGHVDPAAQVRVWAQAADQALADGYTGLRVAADVTPLVGTVDDRAAFGRYEYLIDALIARHSITGMCGYNRRTLGDDVVAEMATRHPLAQRSSTSVRVFGAHRPGVAAVLAGEVDLVGHTLLRAALGSADWAHADGAVTIDARELTFIDHQGLIQLVEQIRRRGAATELVVGRDSVVRPLASLLRLPDLRVVVA
jgi:hypothetical protein